MWTHRHIHDRYWCLVIYLNLGPAWNHCWVVVKLVSLLSLILKRHYSVIDLMFIWQASGLPLSVAYLCYPSQSPLTKILPVNSVPHCLYVAHLLWSYSWFGCLPAELFLNLACYPAVISTGLGEVGMPSSLCFCLTLVLPRSSQLPGTCALPLP